MQPSVKRAKLQSLPRLGDVAQQSRFHDVVELVGPFSHILVRDLGNEESQALLTLSAKLGEAEYRGMLRFLAACDELIRPKMSDAGQSVHDKRRGKCCSRGVA